jgi:hypothetical protein
MMNPLQSFRSANALSGFIKENPLRDLLSPIVMGRAFP